jgi:hypothetical protein
MDIRKYQEFRNRINGSITSDQLDMVQKDLHNISRDQDKVDLYAQIEVRRKVLEKLGAGKSKDTFLTSYSR